MNKALKIIDFFIRKINKKEYNNQTKIEYLDCINFDYLELSKMKVSELFKIYYICFSNLDMVTIENRVDIIKKYLDRIKSKDFGKLDSVYNYFYDYARNKDMIKFYIKNSDYQDMLNQFKTINYPSELELFFTKIFNHNGSIDFNAYNGFLNLCCTTNKLSFVGAIGNIISINTRELNEEAIKNVREEVDAIIKSQFPNIIDNINTMIEKRQLFKIEKNKFDKERQKQLKCLYEIKKDVESYKIVNIDRLNKYIKDDYLTACMYEYNNNLLEHDYDLELKRFSKLNEKSISNREILLEKYNFNIDSNNVLVDDNILEEKLININESLKDIKQYNNIVLSIINNISILNFKKLLNLIYKKYINCAFILENIDKIINDSSLKNFIKNIELFESIGFKIQDIIKSNEDIVFMDNNKVYSILKKYYEYGINFNTDIYNFDFLTEDYSYIIDKYIEIGEYELIKNNPTLIIEDSSSIIKRCIFSKRIDEPIKNEQNKLRGLLRRENSFYIDDSELEECVMENYKELLPIDILECLDNKVDIEKKDLLKSLNKYLINEYSYNIGGLIISKNKVINNMNLLLSNEMEKKYNYDELVYYSIIYGYPMIISKDIIKELRKIFNIKTKTLEFN